MEIGDKRTRKLLALRELPTSALFGKPYPLKRCDAAGCECEATEHCSSHGVHFCRRHFEDHKADWHCSPWMSPVVARC